MKPYEQFTVEDLREFIADHQLLRQHELCTDFRLVIDFERLAHILGLKPRAVRSIISGRSKLQRCHYNLLALHAGFIKPELIDVSARIDIGDSETARDYILSLL
ncbi:hypothetical protein QKW35_17605 [Pontibacterium granulatum]|uniref:hypothetical protein n=1 Tax=Pontibacterium granulatum TaxID=2036029 RepID=UPI002499BF57|nr:hypothetical protein [Pontibacterium granulatum]MDI3326200.1 hypothetical protein [Pontibacterium granulatum]